MLRPKRPTEEQETARLAAFHHRVVELGWRVAVAIECEAEEWYSWIHPNFGTTEQIRRAGKMSETQLAYMSQFVPAYERTAAGEGVTWEAPEPAPFPRQRQPNNVRTA